MGAEQGVKGVARLRDPALNKGTAFSSDERERLGLRGLLPAAVCTQGLQVGRVLENLRRKDHDVERYIALNALLRRNERLFYRTVIDHIDEMLPLIYTPTVGQACKEFAHIFRESQGFYLTPSDQGRIRRMLDNWPEPDVRMIVITDGERILGLGDLGANGMGIPIGKLSLYTACAGIAPRHCMPVQFDVGTNNETLRNDPLYLGVGAPRLKGDAYLELMDEFVEAVQDKFPRALIQFEDFLTPTAYDLLRRYRDKVLCFNDDIQGTASVALAGVLAASRVTGCSLREMRFLFLGAGSAATGIGDLLTHAMTREGLSEREARQRSWFVDSEGLLVKSRAKMAPHKMPYAHDHAAVDFPTAIDSIRPHVLIGATGRPGTFTEAIVRQMTAVNERPVIFALSNPTSRAECTAEQAYAWSDGRVVFASGSPFPAIERPDGTPWRPGQGNNAYVFPGIGLGAIGCEAKTLSDDVFLVAARALASQTAQADLDAGSIYPRMSRIRDVSIHIAAAVAAQVADEGLARVGPQDDWASHFQRLVYDPAY